jgi:hypothetical protein
LITAVDSNILIDVLGANPKFGELSREALRRCLREGALVASDVVWAEAATVFADFKKFLEVMDELSISFSPMTQQAALKAAGFWRRYRATGGPRLRIAADFLIGAHALVVGDRLLTRDHDFYRSYFRGLRIVDPIPGRRG